MEVKTYADMIRLLSTTTDPVYVPMKYPTGTVEWLMIDRWHYLHELSLIDNPEETMFPCYVEIENDGEIFFHPNTKNQNLTSIV